MGDLGLLVAEYVRTLGYPVPDGWRCYEMNYHRDEGVPEGLTKVTGDVPIKFTKDGRPVFLAKKRGTFYLIEWTKFLEWKRTRKDA